MRVLSTQVTPQGRTRKGGAAVEEGGSWDQDPGGEEGRGEMWPRIRGGGLAVQPRGPPPPPPATSFTGSNRYKSAHSGNGPRGFLFRRS